MMYSILSIAAMMMLTVSAVACDGLSVLSQRACVQSYSAAVVAAPVVQYQAPLAVVAAPAVQYQVVQQPAVVLQQQAVVYQQQAVQKVVQRSVRQRIIQRAPLLRQRVKVVQSY